MGGGGKNKPERMEKKTKKKKNKSAAAVAPTHPFFVHPTSTEPLYTEVDCHLCFAQAPTYYR